MPIVYRVQDKDGRGPWKPGFSTGWVESRIDHDNLLPWYVEFGPIHETASGLEHLGAGCMTIIQLRRWFTESEYNTLKGHGYRAVKIKVDSLLGVSKTQCVFSRRKPLRNSVSFINLYPKRKRDGKKSKRNNCSI